MCRRLSIKWLFIVQHPDFMFVIVLLSFYFCVFLSEAPMLILLMILHVRRAHFLLINFKFVKQIFHITRLVLRKKTSSCTVALKNFILYIQAQQNLYYGRMKTFKAQFNYITHKRGIFHTFIFCCKIGRGRFNYETICMKFSRIQ